ncbi:MAG: hypothetical protein RL596_2223 [Bacteroidota bacterium]
MKFQIFFFNLILSLPLFAEQQDTIFIQRKLADIPYPFYHAIYIDTTRSVRDILTNFEFDNYDSATYFDELQRLKPLKKKMSFATKDFPKNWIALHKWQGKYYLYYPSDFGNHIKFKITDSTTLDFSMEGPEPSRLNQVVLLSSTKLVIYRNNHWEGKKVQINIIDKARGIAVFTFGQTKYSKEGYQLLMVDANKAYLFPTIVNYCKTDKQIEFDFDKINFKSLNR